jgi:uncharacterized protein
MQHKKKILSIDGGGILGVFPAAFLAAQEKHIGEPLGRYFDMIVGTSTGGIIALALGLDIPASEILEFYKSLGPQVFPQPSTKTGKLVQIFRQVKSSKYDPSSLQSALERTFGQRKLGQSITRLVIPSMSIATGEVYIFKTAHHERLRSDYREFAVDVAMATSAAPSYFPPHFGRSGVPLVDGGMYANNPVGLAAVEALSMLGWDKGMFDILSLGTTSQPYDVGLKESTKDEGLSWVWGLRLINTFMAGQSSSSFGTAQLLAGHENVLRINPIQPNGKLFMDDSRVIDSLIGLGCEEARRNSPEIVKRFLAEKAEQFDPIYKI